MTQVKEAETTIIHGGNKKKKMTKYYEVGVHEVESMLRKVENGGDEKKLREELIRNSNW